MKKNGSHPAVLDLLPRHPFIQKESHTSRESTRKAAKPNPPIGQMDANLSNPDIRLLLTALTALKKGDFSVRLPLDWSGTAGKIADSFNEVVERNEKMAFELDRISRVVGKEGKISQRASISEASGSWADAVASVNTLISDLVHPISETSGSLARLPKEIFLKPWLSNWKAGRWKANFSALPKL